MRYNKLNLIITYYLTKYFYTNVFIKMFFLFCITFVIKNSLDLSNYSSNIVFCMEDNNPETSTIPKRVTFDSSVIDEDNEIQRMRTKLMKHRRVINLQAAEIENNQEYIEELHSNYRTLYNDAQYNIEQLTNALNQERARVLQLEQQLMRPRRRSFIFSIFTRF